jgi:hypothetical protein
MSDDHGRLELAQDARELVAGFTRIVESGVGEAGVSAESDSEYLRRLPRLAGADFHGSPAPHLAGGQVEDAYSLPPVHGAREAPPGEELRIVGMRKNGEKIERF